MYRLTIIIAILLFTQIGSTMASAGSDAENAAASLPAIPAELLLLAPPNADGTVMVHPTFDLRDINQIDDVQETFEFTGVLTLVWKDPRLAFLPTAGVDELVYQGDYQFDEIATGWYPTVVLANEAGLFEVNGVVLRIQPDGTSTLVQTVNAVAEADMDMSRFPFDAHHLEAVFQIVGFDREEVRFYSGGEPGNAFLETTASVPQWKITGLGLSTRDGPSPYSGHATPSSALVVEIDVERDSFYIRRLVGFPLSIIVLLSFSVFWMERSSLGDRTSVSFIGILTTVTYQLVMASVLPQISYVTLMHAFLIFSFLTMCATVVINLWVGALDKKGQYEMGDRVDRRCRWLFPLVYFGTVGTLVAVRDVIF